jgi:glycosyltransferase involved in cell wall biosynthesis
MDNVQPVGSELISIGLPVYNGEKYIATAIDTVLDQSYADFELVISDNGSTDNTISILKHYATLDSRIRLLLKSSAEDHYSSGWHAYISGAAENFNRVLHAAKGRYFCWHAHDNFWSPDFLAHSLAMIGDGAGCLGGCAMYDHLSGLRSNLGAMPLISPCQSRLEQIRQVVNGRRHGTPVAIYGLYRREALLAVAPSLLQKEAFDWSDLYLVASIIAKFGFTIFATEQPLIFFGYEGQYIEKPVNGKITVDEVMLSKIRSLKARVYLNELLSHPRSFLLSEWALRRDAGRHAL